MHEEGCDRCRSNESYGHSLTELAVPACKSGEYNPPPSVRHMDGKRAASRKGRRVVFLGVCTCRAGPMCPAAGYAFFGGARGPRPTGRYVEPPVGDDVPSARQRRAGRRIPTPVCTLARNDRSKTAGRCGHRPLRNDRKRGGQSCPPLQKDCQRAPLRMSSATARRVTQRSMACFSI